MDFHKKDQKSEGRQIGLDWHYPCISTSLDSYCICASMPAYSHKYWVDLQWQDWPHRQRHRLEHYINGRTNYSDNGLTWIHVNLGVHTQLTNVSLPTDAIQCRVLFTYTATGMDPFLTHKVPLGLIQPYTDLYPTAIQTKLLLAGDVNPNPGPILLELWLIAAFVTIQWPKHIGQ